MILCISKDTSFFINSALRAVAIVGIDVIKQIEQMSPRERLDTHCILGMQCTELDAEAVIADGYRVSIMENIATVLGERVQ